eukprot:1180495-Prorocentrum_minimum.AAC.3
MSGATRQYNAAHALASMGFDTLPSLLVDRVVDKAAITQWFQNQGLDVTTVPYDWFLQLVFSGVPHRAGGGEADASGLERGRERDTRSDRMCVHGGEASAGRDRQPDTDRGVRGGRAGVHDYRPGGDARGGGARADSVGGGAEGGGGGRARHF